MYTKRRKGTKKRTYTKKSKTKHRRKRVRGGESPTKRGRTNVRRRDSNKIYRNDDNKDSGLVDPPAIRREQDPQTSGNELESKGEEHPYARFEEHDFETTHPGYSDGFYVAKKRLEPVDFQYIGMTQPTPNNIVMDQQYRDAYSAGYKAGKKLLEEE